MGTCVIGLCGPSGCGKTTLATMLLSEFPGTLVSLDNYFLLDPPYKKYQENGKNWELPENVDWAACRAVIHSLKKGIPTELRAMRWEENRYDLIQTKPTEYIVVEGFLLFHDEALLQELDLAIYIDIPDDVGLTRRLERENSDENREWFETVTFPEYASRRPVFKSRAGLVLNGQQPLSQNYQIIKERIMKLHL